MEVVNYEALVLLIVGISLGYILGRRLPEIRVEKEAYRQAHLATLIGDLSRLEISNIEQAINRGAKIEAIRIFRSVTGAGLRDAKECVERLVSENFVLQSAVR